MRISDWSSDVCSSDLAQDADGCAGKVAGRLFGQPDCDLLVRRRHDCHEGTRLHGGRAAGAHFGGQVGGGADFAHASLEPHNPVAFEQMRLIVSCIARLAPEIRSEEHTSELQSLMRISYAVFCLKKKKINS